MGGKNHQPCSSRAIESTRLSRHFSSATAHIELANVRLEDVICDELELDITQPGQLSTMIALLQTAHADLEKARAANGLLFNSLRETNFIDCKDSMQLEALIKQLQAKGLINPHFGQLVISHRLKNGFLSCLTWIDSETQKTSGLVLTLIEGIQALATAASADDNKVFSHLEFNTPLSIKPVFAKLYNQLADLNGYFLASAIISTELFYQVAKFGALGEPVEHEALGDVFKDFVEGDAIGRLVTSG